MAVIEWVRFLAGAVCLLCGLGIFLVEMIGVFRFKYVLPYACGGNGRYAWHWLCLSRADSYERLYVYIGKAAARDCFFVVCISGILTSDRASGGDDERG